MSAEAITEKKLPPPSVVTDQKVREQYEAYRKVLDLATQGNYFYRALYYGFLAFDIPVTWFRDKVVMPAREKYGHWPYYQQKFGKGPMVDECGVNDWACLLEANQQFKLDLQVDIQILEILKKRVQMCVTHHGGQQKNNDLYKCAAAMEEYEENELNFFIKYGELNWRGDALAAYTKQKHRLIWERRHPKIMEERRRAYDEHKKEFANGIYNHCFWKSGDPLLNKSTPGMKPVPEDAIGHAVLPRDIPRWKKEYQENASQLQRPQDFDERPKMRTIWGKWFCATDMR